MKHYLKEKLVAKRLRILRYQSSRDFEGSTACLRAEVYGCYFKSGELLYRCVDNNYYNIDNTKKDDSK